MPKPALSTIDDRAIDELVSRFVEPGLPGVVVGISQSKRPIYRKGFGLATMELPVGLTPSVRMRVGSISKQFTALGFLLLCERGQASLDDRLGEHFPEFHPGTRGITMRHLLGHTSGLPDACDIRFRLAGFEGGPTTCGEILSLYREMGELESEPGTRWRYNNGGYMIISEVIERVAGKRLEDFLNDNVFVPIGMWDTVVRRWDTDFLPNSATPHTTTGKGKFEKRYFGVDPAGAGSIMSTGDDMLRWLAHMDHPFVGGEETWSLIRTPQNLTNGMSTGYGFGLSFGKYRGVEILGHQGGWIGGNSHMVKVPEVQLDIVVIANRSDVSSPVIVNGILEACISNLEPDSDALCAGQASSMWRMDQDASLTPQLSAGEHIIRCNLQSPTTKRVVQLFGRGGHQIVSVDGYDIPFRRSSERELVPIAVWSHNEQSISLFGDSAAPASLLFRDFGEVDEFKPIPAATYGNPGRITGRYVSHPARITGEIGVRDDVPQLNVESRFGTMSYTLEPIGPELWRVNSGISGFLDAILRFADGGDSFSINSGTGVTLAFRREP